MSEPSSKRQRSQPSYELLYHPASPGRGEFIRLAFEATGVPFTDVANESEEGYSVVQKLCMNDVQAETDDEDAATLTSNPAVFAPPALRVHGAGKNGAPLLIHQTPTILLYLGDKLGLVPADDEAGRLWVHQLALTALDLNNEVHDTHHPIAAGLYYEDQKDEALLKAKDVRENRIPKFLRYFDRVLGWNGNEKNGGQGRGRYLVGGKLSYADLTLWQILDGLRFAFPKEMEVRSKEFPRVCGTFYDGVKEEDGVREYLASGRRLPYSMGVFRYYPELDRQ